MIELFGRNVAPIHVRLRAECDTAAENTDMAAMTLSEALQECTTRCQMMAVRFSRRADQTTASMAAEAQRLPTRLRAPVHGRTDDDDVRLREVR